MAANYWTSSQKGFWLFTRDKLYTIREDLDKTHHALITQHPYPDRRLMCIFLRDRLLQLAKRLPFRQQCVATALVYMHRFLLSTPLQNVNLFLLVATAFYLSSKTEESPHHIRIVAAEAKSAWPEFMPGDVSRLGEMEFCLISEMRSQLIVWHPYRELINLKENQHLKLSSDELGLAWCVINDSYMTDLPLTTPPFMVAIIAMFLAVVFFPYSKGPQANRLLGVGGPGGAGSGSDQLHSPLDNNNLGPNMNGFSSLVGRPGVASMLGNAMHGLPMNPPVSAASGAQTKSNMNGAAGGAAARGGVSTNEPPRIITPDRQQTLATIAASEKLQNTIKFLVESEIDLKQMVNGTQEIISLYQIYEEYNEKAIKDTVARCLKSQLDS